MKKAKKAKKASVLEPAPPGVRYLTIGQVAYEMQLSVASISRLHRDRKTTKFPAAYVFGQQQLRWLRDDLDSYSASRRKE